MASCSAPQTEKITWLENDAKQAIEQRTLSDFSLTIDEAKVRLKEKYSDLTDEKIEEYIANKYLEVKDFDGVRRMHYKSIGNLALLCPDIRGEWQCRGCDAPEDRKSVV